MIPWFLIAALFFSQTLVSTQILDHGAPGKLGPSLVRLHEQYAGGYVLQGTFVPFAAEDPLIALVEDRVAIDTVAATEDVDTLKDDLVALGMHDAVAVGRIVSGHLPISSLSALGALNTLRFAQPAVAIMNAGSVTSQGDVAMRSNVARGIFGVDGSGVRVGVLSDSFNCLGGAAADVSSGDLPTVTVIQEEPGCVSATDEGRAMLQIVHDVAPGSPLSFATALGGQANFANNIVALKNAGAKVITDDVRYLAEPMFQDGIIAQAVDSVVANGVSYFSSGGNSARQAYESVFRPGDLFPFDSIPSAAGTFLGGVAHNFNPGGAKDHFQSITIPAGTTILLSLQWDSPYSSVSGGAGTQNDLDLYVLDESESVILAGAAFNNLGGDPVEIFGATNVGTTPLNVNLMIVKRIGNNPGFLKYVYFFSGTAPSINEYQTNSGTIYGHANAAGARAVGAAAYFNTPAFGISPPVLNSFSSSGTTPVFFDLAGNRLPTPDPRTLKPEIVAPDGVSTTMPGFSPFFGTSAAAPHAAGVAALALQLKPTLSPFGVYGSLENTAIDMGEPGFDNNSGFGLIQADAALALSLDGLANISTRGLVGTNDNVMIGGFIVTGPMPKKVLIRARGPSMGGTPFFVPGTLQNPFLRIFSGPTPIAQNDNWQTADPLCAAMGFTCGGAAEIAATTLHPCQPNPGQSTAPPGCALESAILIRLPPGPYTAIVSGADGGTGVGLVEAFEVDDGASPTKLTNISTRGRVETVDNVMIGGFIIGGAAPKTVLIRARGPSMGGEPFMVPGTLANPFLQVFSGQTVIAQNDNWQDAPSCSGFTCGGAQEIAATGLDPCQPNPGQTTPPPGCALESAILITLPPGAYTAIVTGLAGTTGVGLIEIFEVN